MNTLLKLIIEQLHLQLSANIFFSLLQLTLNLQGERSHTNSSAEETTTKSQKLKLQISLKGGRPGTYHRIINQNRYYGYDYVCFTDISLAFSSSV